MKPISKLVINQYRYDTPDWPAYAAHLEGGNDARWVLDEGGQPKKTGLICLGALWEDKLIGQLTLLPQPITIPETEWAGERDRTLRNQDSQPHTETLVQTFRVLEAYRRKGVGTALQLEALRITKEFGCLQMRSWSSLDKHDSNYQLKLNLGFGFHPAVQVTPGGKEISGGYFIKRV